MNLSTFLIIVTVFNIIIYAVVWQFIGWWTVPVAVALHLGLASRNAKFITTHF